jgi:predicted RNA-binding Zn-ribbon protein involved in translation (DUF1610 family)
MKAEQLIDAYIAEAITKGMRNAFSKQENKTTCPECGMAIPRYPGKYPSRCPNCGEQFERSEKCQPPNSKP